MDTIDKALRAAAAKPVISITVAAAALAILAITIWVLRSGDSDPVGPAVTAEGFVAGFEDAGGISLISGGFAPAVSPTEALANSELVVFGRVVSMSAGQPSLLGEPRPSIFRVATVEVDETFKHGPGGAPPTVEVYVPGGFIGETGVIVDDTGPAIALNDEVLLFLTPPRKNRGEPGTWVSYLDAKVYPGEITDRGGDAIPVDRVLEAVREAAR